MAELPEAMAPPSSVGVCIVLRSPGLLCVTVLDVVAPGARRDIFFLAIKILLAKKRNPLGP